MAVNTNPHPLHEATRVLRRTPEPGWTDLPAQIMDRVRAVVTPSEPILTAPPSPPHDGSRTWVSARVVIAELRRAVGDASTALSDVGLVLEEDRLTQIRLEVVCAYGGDLHAAGRRAIRVVHAVLDDLCLSDPACPARAEQGHIVEVLVTDVVAGDPRLV